MCPKIVCYGLCCMDVVVIISVSDTQGQIPWFPQRHVTLGKVCLLFKQGHQSITDERHRWPKYFHRPLR